MNAGELRDRIRLQPRVETVNAHGQVVTTWGTEFTLAAKATRLSEQAAQFIIRYRSDINVQSHRILHFDSYWTINNSIHDQKDDRTTLDSDFSQLIEVTHLQSTEREHIEELPLTRPPE